MTTGVYRYVSNPMQIGIVLLLTGWGLVLESTWVVLSAAGCSALFIAFQDVCLGQDGNPLRRTWYLLAEGGGGPQIPCTAAVVIAKKLAGGGVHQAGAFLCLGFFTLEEFMAAMEGFAVRAETDR